MPEKNEKTPEATPGTTATPAAIPQGLATLMNASGRQSNLKSIETDGSFPMYKLKCSDLILRGKYSSNGTAVELIMTVTHINGQQLPQVKQFGVTDPTRHCIQTPARLPKVKDGSYYLEASFGQLDTTQPNTGMGGSRFLPGDDGIRIINMSVPDGIPYDDMWSAEKRVLSAPSLIEANRRKAGAVHNQQGYGTPQPMQPVQGFQPFPTFASPQAPTAATPEINWSEFGG